MSPSSPKMDALYTKLYSKYSKLKKEKDTAMEAVNREQEVKFMSYVTASDEMIEYLRSEYDRLRGQVNDLRTEMALMRASKDEELVQYQKLLMEENQKNKELCDQIQKLQQLDPEGSHLRTNNDKGESREMISVGDSLSDALDGSTLKTTRKRSRHSLLNVQDTVAVSPLAELQTRPLQPACCSRNVDISGGCIFHDLVQSIVGMKFSTVMEGEELSISALHESSGYSFSLTWIMNSSKEPELVYRVLSLGTFERVAPEWMRDMLMFSPSMCPVFFERVSRVMKQSH